MGSIFLNCFTQTRTCPQHRQSLTVSMWFPGMVFPKSDTLCGSPEWCFRRAILSVVPRNGVSEERSSLISAARQVAVLVPRVAPRDTLAVATGFHAASMSPGMHPRRCAPCTRHFETRVEVLLACWLVGSKSVAGTSTYLPNVTCQLSR
jgi:hypothetical protein